MILRDTVTRRRAALVDDAYGNQKRDWANATSQQYAAEVQPVSSTEDVVNQQRTETRWRLFLGASADIEATDRIEWDGDTFEVDGEVERHKARGRLRHIEAVLLRVEQGA